MTVAVGHSSTEKWKYVEVEEVKKAWELGESPAQAQTFLNQW